MEECGLLNYSIDLGQETVNGRDFIAVYCHYFYEDKICADLLGFECFDQRFELGTYDILEEKLNERAAIGKDYEDDEEDDDSNDRLLELEEDNSP